MAGNLAVPPALYDYVLFFECAVRDWTNYGKRSSINGTGDLRNFIDWKGATFSLHPADKGGKTLFGITEGTWGSFAKTYGNSQNNYTSNFNTMGYQGWHDVVAWFWNTYTASGKCANYACAFVMFQMAWGGFGSSAQESLLNTLKKNADKKDYTFKTSGGKYTRIADATHAYSDPMIAYDYMRKALTSYYYNISTPDKSNHVFRMGWLNRAALPFTPYGLYIPTTFGGANVGLKYTSSLNDWEATVNKMIIENKKGYVKIFDWGASPESIAKMAENSSFDWQATATGGSSGGYGGSSSGAYGSCGGVYQLGNYSNAPDAQIVPQQTQNREEVLNTLVGGSYTPDEVKKCSELITSDKKKNQKTKSEA